MAEMRLNEKLRTLREKCGFTQEQVAKVLNVDRSSYTYYETGKTEPSISSLIKLANMFKVGVDELLDNSAGSVNVLHDSDRKRRIAPAKVAENNTSHIYDLEKDEKQLLCYFRALDADKKQMAMDAVKGISTGKKID